ncbi:MAG: hypothetical protein IKT84_00635 [Bacteroidales bacterium]|nr:hypothetical protein [Bacteroidales bacterium]MBR5831162.1 hypothetical protein [Bacteroidales bacterium]
MRKLSLLLTLILGVSIFFSSCQKEENWAAEIAGTYKGTNFSKTETGALVVLGVIDETHVSVRYDAGIIEKDLTPDASELTITKEGDIYKLNGSTALETMEGTVQNGLLKLKVYMSSIEIANIEAQKVVEE